MQHADNHIYIIDNEPLSKAMKLIAETVRIAASEDILTIVPT